MRPVEERAAALHRRAFGAEPAAVASAPGRVNLIGEHTDYSGGLALPFAIDLRVGAAASPGRAAVVSDGHPGPARLDGELDGSWADLPRGIVRGLAGAGHRVPAARIAVASDLPEGAGLASSAALEVAIAVVLDALFELRLSKREVIVVCREAESAHAGVPCGALDQAASVLGCRGSALLLDCRSLEAHAIRIPWTPEEALTLVVTTGRRRVADTAYAERRAAVERAAARLGLASLRDATVADLADLPGDERRLARHVVTENARVQAAAEALAAGDLDGVGALLSASHASLRDDFAVSTPALDAVVEAARDTAAAGARLTGAGFGGSAIVLVAAAAAVGFEAALTRRFGALGLPAPATRAVRADAGAEIARPA